MLCVPRQENKGGASSANAHLKASKKHSGECYLRGGAP
jgi:hypothetical protein